MLLTLPAARSFPTKKSLIDMKDLVVGNIQMELNSQIPVNRLQFNMHKLSLKNLHIESSPSTLNYFPIVPSSPL